MTLLYGDVGAAAFDDEPAIRAVDDIFASAIHSGASDVHIEPWSEGGRVRERVDGFLRESRRISARLLPRVLSRIKLLAGMDIADRRMPQDGRYAIERPGGPIDARVSSIPTIDGEKLAIRLLDARASVPTLEALGMPPNMTARFRRVVQAAAGLVVICGPTGSGKTTTLYAAISERNVTAQQVCSIEDPVEIRLDGIAQVQVNVRAGLTFASGLRSLLRQDPNTISVGEMRDAETAAVAASAALSGQLVLTTLHSRSALAAIERLADLGMSSRRIGAVVNAIVSQRLLRRLCAACKRPARAGHAGERFGVAYDAIAAEAVGCERCAGTGYRGRRGVFEMLAMTADLRHVVETEHSPAQVRQVAFQGGYEPMVRAAGELILRGESSIDETSRALNLEAA